MRVYTVILAANVEARLIAAGRYFRVIDATGDIATRVDSDQPFDMQQGIGVRLLDGFEQLSFKSATAQTMKIAVSQYDIDDSRLSLSAAVDLTKANALTSTGDVSLLATAKTLIKAANPARREIIVGNLVANAATFRVGDTSAGAARGTELSPGETITLTTAAAVYGYNGTVVAESVSVLEVLD